MGDFINFIWGIVGIIGIGFLLAAGAILFLKMFFDNNDEHVN